MFCFRCSINLLVVASRSLRCKIVIAWTEADGSGKGVCRRRGEAQLCALVKAKRNRTEKRSVCWRIDSACQSERSVTDLVTNSGAFSRVFCKQVEKESECCWPIHQATRLTCFLMHLRGKHVRNVRPIGMCSRFFAKKRSVANKETLGSALIDRDRAAQCEIKLGFVALLSSCAPQKRRKPHVCVSSPDCARTERRENSASTSTDRVRVAESNGMRKVVGHRENKRLTTLASKRCYAANRNAESVNFLAYCALMSAIAQVTLTDAFFVTQINQPQSTVVVVEQCAIARQY